MEFRVFRIADQGAFFVFVIFCALISGAALVLRFVASRRANTKPGAEDWFALVSVLLFLARIGYALYWLVLINGRRLDLTLDPNSFEKVFKMVFASTIIAMLDQTFAKLSICALYQRIFGVSQVYRRWVYLLAAAQCATCVTFVCMQLLLCRPLHKFWDWLAPGECISPYTMLLATEPPNSLVDFGLVALAMVVIRPMQLDSKAKWKLRLLFGLGSLAGVFGFIKIGIAYNSDPHHVTASPFIWGAVHSLLGILCCCAPVYGNLHPSRLWGCIASKVSACSPWSKSKGKKDPALQLGPWQTASLDPYFQGEGWFQVNGYTGSSTCLATSNAQGGASYSNKSHPEDSIQVDRRVDVDHHIMHQASDQENLDYLSETSGLLRPSPSHLRASRVPTNV